MSINYVDCVIAKLGLLLLALILMVSCGAAEPTATPLPATATQTTLEPTHTPRPPTASLAPPTATSVSPTSTAELLPPAVGTPEPPAVAASPTMTPELAPQPLTPLDGRGGGMIALNSERDGNSEIYTMDADGGNVQRLTEDPGYDAWPTWSPDGSQVAFVSDRSGNPDIYVMNADGSNVRQLTDHPANDIWPAWSPDGRRIVFPSRRDGNFELYLINADGTNLQRLTNTPGHEDFPAWSPDGRRIVFSRVEGNDGTFVMTVPDGTGAEQGSTAEQRLLEFRVLEPDWSPDGTRIAACSDHEGFRAIYVMDADGGTLHKLSNTRAGENCPAWSPDGSRIAFVSWRDGDGEIYVMEADGSNPQKLTDNRFEDEFPAWRPGPASSGGGGYEAVTMTYGGPLNDRAYDVLPLADGGTLIVGQANNTGLSHTVLPGDAHLIRTDGAGNVVWEKDYGGGADSEFYSLIQVGHDEYVVQGQIAGLHGSQVSDTYLVKIDGDGNEIWSHTYGGGGNQVSKMVRQTADGGFIVAADRKDRVPTADVYGSSLLLIKTDAEGNEVWTGTYGEKLFYLGWGVAQTPDGGYVLIGWEAKTIEDRDVIAIKTDATGEMEWSRSWDLDPGDRDGGFDLILTSDGHIVIACVQSMDSGVRGAALIKVDLAGNEIWVKEFGVENAGNEFWDIMEDLDGGYVMAGDTIPGRDPATGEDIRQGLIVKTDPDGEVVWQAVWGATEYREVSFSSAVVLPGGGYVFVGAVTRSGERYSDMVWLRLTPGG